MSTFAKVSPIQIGSPDSSRYFTLAEANKILPLVQQITRRSFDELQIVKREMQSMLPVDPRMSVLEERYENIVKNWVAKMERLGLVVKSLWLVDFDTGEGYLCWKFPEHNIRFYHEYTEGFASRRPIQEVIDEIQPDWA